MSSSIVDRNGGTTSASPTTSRDVGLASSAAVKVPCVAIALTPITLSGEQTIDTVSCVTGDPVAVAGQVDATTNGIWIVSTGAWQRSPDFNRNDDVVDGSLVVVTGGTNQGIWSVVCTTSPAIIGTTAISFANVLTLTGALTIAAAALLYKTIAAADAADALRVLKAGDTMSGPLTLGGLLDTGATGQIKFPATANPSSDANTIDDYEEGTFTPTFAGTGCTFAYLQQVGRYTKIGRLVVATIRLALATVGNTLAANTLAISSLPFAAANPSSGNSFYTATISWINATSSYVAMQGRIAGGASQIIVQGATAATTSITAQNASEALAGATGSIMTLTMSYEV